MNFTYVSYAKMLSLLRENHYIISTYEDFQNSNKCVILRHDVDFCLEAALRFAELEYKNGIRSTYFVLLATDFYNLFHKKANDLIKEIRGLGHYIGLHFDETNYSISNKEELVHYVEKEVSLMSQALEMDIKSVSMHRPSKWLLEADVQFDSVINSYSKLFFHNFKYLSDSRMYWQEDVYKTIQSNSFERMHILTHPIWYGEEERTIKDIILHLIRDQKDRYYDNVRQNIRDLDVVLLRKEI